MRYPVSTGIAAPAWFAFFCAWASLWIFSLPVQAERIKDLASIQGIRPNQLIGYGLVVGLDGTGDQTVQTPFTIQSLNNMLMQLGINVPPGTNMRLRNVAAVMVTAALPPLAQPGQAIDVTVSSMGNARSLRGGTLLMTPLKGIDGQVYGVAQGNLLVGGIGAAASGSKVQVNHLNAGRIPGGATVERAVPVALGQNDMIRLELNTIDFSTAKRIVDAVNTRFGMGTAAALDGRAIQVRTPPESDQRVAFLAEMESLAINPAQMPARVIVNSRTGSVVMNQAATVDQCAIAHGNLTVVISTEPVISQPGPFSSGRTVQAQRSTIEIKQESGMLTMVEGASLAEVVKALNAIGATPQDLLAILQAMKSAGALRAELEII
ncbi:flagellar basal body P-ring protein FlgI [Nitrosospira multiformis]|uniref:flagellar basal body P-ring protein FlgI n=1 Tax=Nitrosospira multiformis TaxID=1231 RepID=UPI000895F469|nr:flagellar basal body P-ring protein FlgI [Nitrosospira multiformis]SDZ83327.1 flagellar P-ring protein precursor FlgI [Nitrosospira multiformis]